MSASCRGKGDFVPPCLISNRRILQFMQECSVNFAIEEKGGILLLLSHEDVETHT